MVRPPNSNIQARVSLSIKAHAILWNYIPEQWRTEEKLGGGEAKEIYVNGLHIPSLQSSKFTHKLLHNNNDYQYNLYTINVYTFKPNIYFEYKHIYIYIDILYYYLLIIKNK